MIELNKIKYIYFVGIGGIGMSSLAKYFHKKGMIISGFDDNLTEITCELEKKRVPCFALLFIPCGAAGEQGHFEKSSKSIRFL